MFKSIALVAIASFSLCSAVQAQFYYYTPKPITGSIRFDATTGVVTVQGSRSDDKCYIRLSCQGMTIDIGNSDGWLRRKALNRPK